jgi:hypothetical protein
VQTYDVTDLLIGGHNVVGALLSDGWWRGQNSVARRVDDYGTTTAFVAQLVVTFTSGRTVTFGTDDTWRSTPSHIVRADLIAGEVHDLRRRADWQHWPDWAPTESKTTAPRSCARRPRRQSVRSKRSARSRFAGSVPSDGSSTSAGTSPAGSACAVSPSTSPCRRAPPRKSCGQTATP